MATFFCEFESARSKAYSSDLRWRMVYQRYFLELPYNQIAKNLNVDPSTVYRTVKLFDETGTVCSIQGFHENTTKKLSIHESWPFLKRFWMTLQCAYMSCSTMCSTQVGTTLVFQVSVGSYISSVFHTKS